MAGMARVFVERRELPDELQALLETEAGAECTPHADIIETSDALEIVMDLPGVAAAEVEIVLAHNVLLIAGRKRPRAYNHADAAFHVAERAFGRFGRAILLESAFDAGRASASLTGGVLRVVLPRQVERRGRPIRIPIRTT